MPLSNPKDVVNQKTFTIFGKMLFTENRDDWISCFRDLENNALFPMKMTFTGFELVYAKKPRLEDLIIPLEEVLRFEKKYRIGKSNQEVPPATDHQEKSQKKELEDTKTPSPKTIDTAFEDKQSPAPEKI